MSEDRFTVRELQLIRAMFDYDVGSAWWTPEMKCLYSKIKAMLKIIEEEELENHIAVVRAAWKIPEWQQGLINDEGFNRWARQNRGAILRVMDWFIAKGE